MATTNSKTRKTTPKARTSERSASPRIPPETPAETPAGPAEVIHFPRYFLLTMREAGREALDEWLKTSGAPAAILNLWRAIDTLEACLEDPEHASAQTYVEALRDVAIGRQLANVTEWPEFSLTQPEDEEARDE